MCLQRQGKQGMLLNMATAYSERGRVDPDDLAGKRGKARIVSAIVREDEGRLYLRLEETLPLTVEWKGYHPSIRGRSKASFVISKPEVYRELLQELGITYNPSRDNGRNLAELQGKEVMTYKQNGQNVAAVQPFSPNFTKSRDIQHLNKGLYGYSTIDLGDGIIHNDVVTREELMKLCPGDYGAALIKIAGPQYDADRGELNLDLRSRLGDSDYSFMFTNEEAIGHFLKASEVSKAEALTGRKMVGLIAPLDNLEWIIASPRDAILDDVLLTRLEMRKPTC